MTIETQVNEILASTYDELLKLNAEQLGLKSQLITQGEKYQLQLRAGFPAALLTKTYLPQLERALQQAIPNTSIQIELSAAIKPHRTQLAGKGLRGVKNTIAIASGKGGVGKSTVTVNLAIALAQLGARVGILDADIYGPSIPLMMGHKKPLDLQGDYYLPALAHGVQTMSIGYLSKNEEALIWRGPMLAKSLIQMLDITLWDELDYLLIDLPPGTGDIQLSLVQKIPLTGAVVVTTPQTVATLDAQKAIAMFQKTNIEVLGIVENMSLHQCSQCGHEEAIFGQGGAQQLSQKQQVPLLGQLPLHGRIRSHCDEGKPTMAQNPEPLATPFLTTALRTAIAVAKKPLNYADKFPDIVVE